jgi:tRNA(Ile)-lysidine synthase
MHAPKINVRETLSLTPDDFTRLLTTHQLSGASIGSLIGTPPRIGVALSGGMDSMTLTLLLQEWVASLNGILFSFTVDHGLRENSRAEALQVSAWMQKRGIPNEILTWAHEDQEIPTTRLQERARTARFELLLKACRDHQLSALFLAHTQDDQAETFLMRLAHQSGVDGLSAIRPIEKRAGIYLMRPLLEVSKSTLQETLSKRFNHPYVEDLSNQNASFERVRIRQASSLLRSLGITPEVLTNVIEKQNHASQALEMITMLTLKKAFTLDPLGFGILERQALVRQPYEIKRRVFERILRAFSPTLYSPRGHAIHTLINTLESKERVQKTLAGLLIEKKGTQIFFYREPKALEGKEIKLITPQNFQWDHRFEVEFDRDAKLPKALNLKALGVQGRLDITRIMPKLTELPKKALETLPSFWDTGTLWSVPALNMNASIQTSVASWDTFFKR